MRLMITSLQYCRKYLKMRSDFAKSTITGFIQFAVNALLVFITIPTFIRILGAEAYGVFSLLTVIGSLNTFANLGLSTSLVRFLAKQGKSFESNLDIVVILLIISIITIPIFSCVLLFKEIIVESIFSIPVGMKSDAIWLFTMMLISTLFILYGQIFSAILDSMQKVYLTNIYQMINNISYWVFMLLALLMGYSLRGIGIAMVASTVIWFCIVTIGAISAWGGLSLKGMSLDGIRGSARKQLKYGLQVYSGGMISIFYEPLTKIILAKFLGVTEVGIFDIGLKVRSQLMGLAGKLMYPIYPILSHLEDKTKTRLVVHDVEQKLFLVILPLVTIILLITKTIVTQMFSVHGELIAITISSISSAFLVGSITVMPNYLFLLAKGHASKVIILQSINVVVNLVVIIVCIPIMGYYAVLFANALAILCSWVTSLYYQWNYLNSLIFDSFRQMFKVIITFIVSLFMGLSITLLLKSSIGVLIVCPIAVLITTSLLYRYTCVVNQVDIARYFGENSIVGGMAIRLLVKK